MFYGTYGVEIKPKGGVRQVTVPRLPQNRQRVPSERDESGAPCRYPGVVYWPDIDPCVRPTSALYQDDAAWKKYQQTGFIDHKGGYYKEPEPEVKDEVEEKEEATLTVETEESFWSKYQWYLIGGGVAAAVAAAWFLGRKRSS
jgi:hypothetical protein